MKYHYIYMIKFNTGQIYIGSRTSKVPPEQDTKYWGSPVTYKHLWEDASLERQKFIIKVCKNVDEKRKIESKLIKEAWEKYGDLCLNRHASPGFHPEACKKGGKSAGHRAKELGIGIHALTIEECKKYGEMRSKPFKLLSPQGKIIEGFNMRDFCQKYNLTPSNLCSVINGKNKSHKGWRLPGTPIVEIKEVRVFTLKTPNGEIISDKNLKKFCRENNLDPSSIRKVLKGKQKFHKGWTLP